MLDIPLRPSISHLALTANQDRELHLHRSRRPLGVWSSDRYQNEARKLYFWFSETVFVFRLFSARYCGKCTTRVEQNVTKNQIWSTMILPKLLDKILKIQYFTIRQLPSQKPLPAVVLAKNERIRDHLECAHPIPVDSPGIEMLTNDSTSSMLLRRASFWSRTG